MTDKILTFFEFFLSFFPESLVKPISIKIFKILIWYECKWLFFYVTRLEKTKNYYKTLSDLNKNKWCPETLAQNFVNYVQINNSDLVHT